MPSITRPVINVTNARVQSTRRGRLALADAGTESGLKTSGSGLGHGPAGTSTSLGRRCSRAVAISAPPFQSLGRTCSRKLSRDSNVRLPSSQARAATHSAWGS